MGNLVRLQSPISSLDLRLFAGFGPTPGFFFPTSQWSYRVHSARKSIGNMHTVSLTNGIAMRKGYIRKG